MIVPAGILSAFMSNATVVAMFIPAIQDWAQRLGVPASKLLRPLIYAAILGGTCTPIGTSTNLVIDGLLQSRAGLRALNFGYLAEIDRGGRLITAVDWKRRIVCTSLVLRNAPASCARSRACVRPMVMFTKWMWLTISAVWSSWWWGRIFRLCLVHYAVGISDQLHGIWAGALQIH